MLCRFICQLLTENVSGFNGRLLLDTAERSRASSILVYNVIFP